jgi:8-oxo-dGTP pyrophosphatase MutT (NUDIX family)
MTVDRLRQALQVSPPTKLAADNLIPSAVLVPLFLQEQKLHVLFTQRAQTVTHHRGQISFPGGAHESVDESFLATALRETQEEIGLEPMQVEVLGELQPRQTITGFLIQSFVGLIPYPYPFRVNDQEVARLITLPLPELLSHERWSLGPYAWRGKRTMVYYCRYNDITVWGATARILLDLLNRFDPSLSGKVNNRCHPNG